MLITDQVVNQQSRQGVPPVSLEASCPVHSTVGPISADVGGSAGRRHRVQILRQQEILTLKMQNPLILTTDDLVLKALVREELNKI